MNVIKESCSFYGLQVPPYFYFDSLKLARNVWPKLESHRLTDLGKYFEINYKAHDALEDSRTCGIIVQKAAEELKKNDIQSLLNALSIEIKAL